MSEPDVVPNDIDIDSEETEDEFGRRRWGLIAAVVLLLLLLFSCVTASEVWLTGGDEQARFVARNLECLQCHTELIPDFSRTAVHDPFARKECTTCHTPHGKEVTITGTRGMGQLVQRYRTMLQWLPFKWFFTLTEQTASIARDVVGGGRATGGQSAKVKGAASMLVAPEQELCWTCHGSMGAKLDDQYQHQPFRAGRCSSCHNPHASDHRALLTQASNKLCFTCHPIGAELGRMQAHSPAEKGFCIDCHDPHASNFRGIIVTNQRDLCLGCHPTVAVKSNMPVQHAPFMNDNCTACHQPHGSDYEPLLNAIQPDLCYDCHPQIQTDFAQPSHHPVGITMECGSCHDPHAAQFRALINAQDNDFCYQCHGTIQAGFGASRHEGVLCVRCHTPHGSVYAPVLLNRNPNLCLECHEQASYDESTKAVSRNNHPVQPMHYDVLNGSPLTCTSSCHNPHGTNNNFMLRHFKYPLDGGCLMCHRTTPGSRVGVDY